MSLPRCQQRRAVKTPICFDCELQSKCKFNCMPGQGLKNQIMIVGEKPTDNDVSQREPFMGLEGQKLKYLLSQLGMKKEQVYLTYAIKCDSPKKIAASKAKKIAQLCRGHLFEEIAWVKPKAIITLGSTALSAIVGEDMSADDYRGFPMPLQGKAGQFNSWIIPTYSITQAIGSSSKDPIIVRDLKLAKSIAKEGYQPKPIDIDVRVLTGVDEVHKLVSALWKARQFSYDLETGGLNFLKHPIQCASFSADGKTAYVVPIDREFPYRGDYRKWTDQERKQVLWLLKKAFLSPASKTAQNGKFDNKFLRREGIAVRNFGFDTMLAHHLVDEGKPHDLMFIAQWYGLVHEKYDHALELQKKIHGKDGWMKFDPRTLYHYAGIDAAVTQGARPILEAELARTKTEGVFKKISMPQAHVLADMEYRGAHIDLKGMNEIIETTDDKIRKLKIKVKDIMKVDDFNPNSTKQLKDYMKAKRVRIEKLTPSGEISVDEEVLKGLVDHSKVGDVARMTLEARSLSKLKGTYLDGKPGSSGKKTGLRHKLDERHYIHTNFLIHGTYTGRLSSKEPNLQNIPKDWGIRQLFIPDEKDDFLMGVDYKQLEVRVAAAISKDPVLIREVVSGVDMHSRNAASLLLKVSEEELAAVYADNKHQLHKRYSEARRAAKAVTFGVLYGSTAHGVCARNKLDLLLVEEFIKKFFKKYRVLANWIKNQHTLVRKTHMVRTPTGRYTRFHDLDWAKSKYCPPRFQMIRTGEVERVSVNMPIQGFGSDIFQSHKIKTFKYLAKNKMQSRLVLSLHDGFILNCKPDEREVLADVIPQIMHSKLNKGTKFEVPLDVDVEFGKCWEGKDDE